MHQVFQLCMTNNYVSLSVQKCVGPAEKNMRFHFKHNHISVGDINVDGCSFSQVCFPLQCCVLSLSALQKPLKPAVGLLLFHIWEPNALKWICLRILRFKQWADDNLVAYRMLVLNSNFYRFQCFWGLVNLLLLGQWSSCFRAWCYISCKIQYIKTF